jgi:hypothetical protein
MTSRGKPDARRVSHRLNEPDKIVIPFGDGGEKKFYWGSVASTLKNEHSFIQFDEAMLLIWYQ